MAEQNNTVISRRAALATLVGGGTIATALASTGAGPVGDALGSFGQSFTSPFFALERGDHVAWAAETGAVLSVAGAPALRVLGVETFAAYGASAAGLIRGRAFVVNFETVSGAWTRSEGIASLTHPQHGRFDLALKSTPELPTFVQAVFN